LIDPRIHPDPPLRVTSPTPADELEQILDLIRLYQAGRIYAVERWIDAGKPLQARTYYRRYHHFSSPLRTAIARQQHDLAHLLLCNGYRPDEDGESPLDLAMRARDWDVLELLLSWGADPQKADPESVLDTYQIDVMERFWSLGLDLTDSNTLAHYLASRTRNRPAYGWAKRHREDPRVAMAITMALGEAAAEGREKATHLLLWAGADAHRRVPVLRWERYFVTGEEGEEDEEEDEDSKQSSVYMAISYGKGKVLSILKPDPDLDDFDELWRHVADGVSAEILAALKPPKDWSPTIIHLMHVMTFPYLIHGSDTEALSCLEQIAGHGAKLTSLEPSECGFLRRDLLRRRNDFDLGGLLRWLSSPRNCDPAIYQELTRTPGMQAAVTSAGIRTGKAVQTRKGRRPPYSG
jgi:hypothetical protein